jgi:hypothetical protein
MSRVQPRRESTLALVVDQFECDELAPLPAFCELLDASPAVILRWVVEGRPTPRGRVHLEATVTAEGWFTTASAVERFQNAARM